MPTRVTHARSLELVPSARRLVESLRDIGYDLSSAIADVIDNSIAAEATRVSVDLSFDGADSWVTIADDGVGMSADVLNEAMRYGTTRDYSDTQLGKFGLGLKTASMSQCRRLTVATRSDPGRRSIEIRQWDLDHIEEVDRWEVLKVSPSDVRQELTAPLREHPGTVVLWEDLDRVLRYKSPDGRWALDGFARLCRQVEDHLAMVFHRFLSGEARRTQPLVILLNGNRIDAWDPFCRSEEKTRRLAKQTLTLQHEGRTHRVTIAPYILPNEAQFSSPAAHKRAGGPKRWNDQQGLYVYRNDRLIQSGGWSRLRTSDEHTKLARIAVDFPRRADSAFELNVAKMRIRIPDDLRQPLTTLAAEYAKAANAAYRKPPPTKVAPRQSSESGDGGRPEPSNSEPGHRPRGRPSMDPIHLLIHRALRGVKEVVQSEFRGEPRSLERVLTAIDRIDEDLGAELKVLGRWIESK